MFEKMQRAFWKALTPDLVVDEPKQVVQPVSGLATDIVAALGVWITLNRSSRWR